MAQPDRPLALEDSASSSAPQQQHRLTGDGDTVALDQTGGVTKIPRAWVERFEVLTPTESLPVMPERGHERNAARRVG